MQAPLRSGCVRTKSAGLCSFWGLLLVQAQNREGVEAVHEKARSARGCVRMDHSEGIRDSNKC